MASNSDQNQTPNPLPKQGASPSSTASSHPPLQFITLTERPGSHKNDYSYTVRSHAMQAFLHEKKNSKGDKGKQRLGSARPHDPKTSKQLSGKFKLDSWSRKPRSKKAQAQSQATREYTSLPSVVKEEDIQRSEAQPATPVETYGNGLPLSLTNSRTRELLYHCILPPSLCPLCLSPCTDNTAFVSNALAINYDNACKPFSITDSALLHATLCLVAQHEDLLRGPDESSENLFHKGEAMRLMNRRLLEEWHCLSDADITAVAIFVILESINGTFEAASAHRVGLLKMARLLGGIGNFGLNGVVLRVLAWSDIVFSTRFGSQPKFSCLSESFSSSYELPPTINDTYSTMFENPATNSIFHTLRYISTIVDTPNLSVQEKKGISDALYDTEYTLLASLHLRQSNSDFDSLVNLSSRSTHEMLTTAFHIASLLYLQLIIRELPNPALLHRRLLSHLTTLINNISIRLSLSTSLSELDPALHPDNSSPHFTKEELDILLWIVFVGVAASSDRESRITFVMAVRGAEPGLIWCGVDDVAVRLRRVVWREGVCEELLEGSWKEMKGQGSWY